MTADEAFVKFLHTRADHDLPWMIQAVDMRPIFMAGWHARDEGLMPGAQQARMPLGGGHDYTGSENAPEKLVWVNPVKMPAETITPEQIYAAYPRKVGKLAAIKAIQKAIKAIGLDSSDGGMTGAEILLDRTQSYAAAVKQWPASDKQYVPHTATWFNQGRYEDDPKEWQRGTATTSAFSKHH